MAKTIQQIQEMITLGYDIRQVINEIADYIQANPGGGSAGNLDLIENGVNHVYANSDFGTNIFLGPESGVNNTPLSGTQGEQITAFGFGTLNGNTVGYALDAFGYNAGRSNTTGTRGVNIGYQSGFLQEIANFFVNIGTDAGFSNTVDNQIFIGFHNGKLVDDNETITGINNISIGNENSTFFRAANNNVVVGHLSGYKLRDGYKNLLTGGRAGFNLRDGYYCVVVGFEAGEGMVDDYLTTYLGFRSGYAAAGTFANTGLGSYSLYNNTTGNGNTAIGYQSAQSLLTGWYNTLVGFAAGNNASQKTDANFSTAIGHNSYNTKDYQVVLGSSDVVETLIGGVIKKRAFDTAPASASAAGEQGEVRITATFIYVCTATNTWVRSALTTW